MDFPVCPACGQSVIDDDVDDCPFCGASMKAKPGSKPVAKSPAAKPTAARPAAPARPAPGGKPASAAPATGTARPGAKPGPADDFPFEAESAAARTAIQAMPASSKGRTLEVVCPMCETTGYVPPTAAGKEVKCANPKCMVPVFKAPAPQSQAAPAPEPVKSSGNLLKIGGITVAAVAVVGAGIVFLPGLLGSRPSAPTMSNEALELIQEQARSNTTPANPADMPATPTTPVVTALPDSRQNDAAPTTPDQYVAAALKLLNESSLKAEGRQQRSKAFCRQMAAGACLRAGDLKAASDHLAQLVVVGPNVPYYRIEPLMDLFWIAWSSGDQTTARRHLDMAMTDAKRLPSVGRTRLDLAGRLAGPLAVTGQIKEALALLDVHQSADDDGQLAAQVQMATDGRVARVTRNRAVLPWTRPQAVAATASLVIHGQQAVARSWAEAQTSETGRAECLATWAELTAAQKSGGDIADAVKTLSPALAVRVWARASAGHVAAGDKPAAAAALKTAQDLLLTLPVPAEPELPPVKGIVAYDLPAEPPLIQAVNAAAEVAFAQTLSPDQLTQAEATLELGLKFARGLTPGWPAVQQRLQEAEQAGASGLRELLKREMSLKSDDVANQNVIRYRKVLDDLEAASRRRVALQESMMLRLVNRGLKDKVWSVVSNRSAESNPSRRDDFVATPLVGALLQAFQGTETQKEIAGVIPAGTQPLYPDVTVADHLLGEDVSQAARYVSQAKDRDYVALMSATRLAAEGNSEQALSFISKLDDLVLREEAYRLASALLSQQGKADACWKQAESLQQATEKCCVGRGLVTGLKSDPAVIALVQ